MRRLAEITHKDRRRIIGINSGTSMDGVDVVCVVVEGSGLSSRMKLEHYADYAFASDLRVETLRHMETPGLEHGGRLHYALGAMFGEIVLRFLKDHDLRAEDVDCIGSHGQTIGHFPETKNLGPFATRATLQWGDPSVIAVHTGITTIGDFRAADVAAGGGGAPLTPYFDYVFLRHTSVHRIVLNIGGIANLTLLHAGGNPEDVLAWDTGPGNMLIDAASRRFTDASFDNQGIGARRGTVHGPLLQWLMDLPYFAQKPPKSTGREVFGPALLDILLRQFPGVQPDDWLATLTEFTAASIAEEYKRWGRSPEAEWVVSGGGTKNRFLMERLRSRLHPAVLRPSDELGIPASAKEAMMFAFLANECLMGQPANLPSVTGAARRVVLGKICCS